MTYLHHYISPLGPIIISSDGEAITGLWFDGQKYFGSTISEPCQEADLPVFEQAKKWLTIYFSGCQPDFMPPLRLSSSPFREKVWKMLLSIPFGETMTYGQLAAQLAQSEGLKSMSSQAVGGAVGHNPISLIIPCHRVVGAKGQLTGYAGGVDKKEWLLKMEKKEKTIS